MDMARNLEKRNIRTMKTSSRDLIHHLYELWQPQFSESYRPGASVVSPEPEMKNTKKTSKIGKLRAVETVVETINLMQKTRSLNRGTLTRISSVGSLESTSPPASVVRKASVKRSLSQSSNLS